MIRTLTIIIILVWVAISIFIGHFANDAQYFLLDQLNEVLLLLCIVVNTKGIVRMFVTTCTVLSFVELIDEIRGQNTIVTLNDYFVDFIALFITLYLIHRWLRSKKK